METLLEPTQNITTELRVDTQKIAAGIKAFEAKKIELQELADSANGLTINGIEDREGLKVLSSKRKELKAMRVEITKQGKSMRDTLTAVSRNISAKEKELVEIIEPVEKELQSKEDAIEAEKERIRQGEIERENARIQKRIDALAQYGYQIDYTDIKAMSDETFDKYLEAAKAQFENEQAEKAEQERLQREREEKERLEREAEAKRIEDERKELEALRKKQEEAQRIIDEQNARIAAENKRIEDEKAAIEAARQKEIEDKKRAEEIRIAQEKAAESARLKAIEDAKEAERIRAEKEEKERIAAERKAARQPDKIKIQEYIKAIKSVPVPDMKTEDGQVIMSQIQELITRFDAYSTEKANAL